jgi:cytochrome P450
MTENFFFRNEHPVMGGTRRKWKETNGGPRRRTQSEPEVQLNEPENESPVRRHRIQSEPEVRSTDFSRPASEQPSTTKPAKKSPSILDQILRKSDCEGRGISTTGTTEISLLLWMMLDAGQGWTSMALSLLSKHKDACREVQAEIDLLEKTYGKDRLFTSFVLGKMEKIDNLIYEAMRFCPQFLGGMKVLNQTIELGDVQIPKNSNVIFCSPHHDDSFTLDYSPRQRPEEMGMIYPSTEL